LKARRITIMIDEDVDKRIRILQSRELVKTNAQFSYSKMANIILRAGLKVTPS
jgi:hypothetical protein